MENCEKVLRLVYEYEWISVVSSTYRCLLKNALKLKTHLVFKLFEKFKSCNILPKPCFPSGVLLAEINVKSTSTILTIVAYCEFQRRSAPFSVACGESRVSKVHWDQRQNISAHNEAISTIRYWHVSTSLKRAHVQLIYHWVTKTKPV